jgi:hypothetical protein
MSVGVMKYYKLKLKAVAEGRHVPPIGKFIVVVRHSNLQKCNRQHASRPIMHCWNNQNSVQDRNAKLVMS